MRSDNVSIERMIIHAVLGSSCVPKAPRSFLMGPTTSRAPTTPPATRSEWPPTYFVSEYITRSAPHRSGRQKHAPEERVAPHHGGRSAALPTADLLGQVAHHGQIDQTVGRVRG